MSGHQAKEDEKQMKFYQNLRFYFICHLLFTHVMNPGSWNSLFFFLLPAGNMNEKEKEHEPDSLP